jgi:hypothetical protein
MQKKNILVFPCGSEIGLDIYDGVKYSTYFHLIGASSVDDHGKYVFSDYVGGLPFVTDSAFCNALTKVVAEKKIDAIFPATDMAVTCLKRLEKEIGSPIITSSLETTELCLSKQKTYNALQNIIRTPSVYNSKPVSFPVFVKPAIGHSSIGAKKIESQDALDKALSETPGLLILEYLPGEEYTVDCFTDKNGTLLFCAARQRNRIKDGISVNTSFVQDQKPFIRMAEAINSSISFRGAWFFQVKRANDGQLCLLETAARFGGSSILCKAIGVNLPLMTLFDAFDYPVKIQQANYYVELDRALGNRYRCDIEYDTVYVDYDDCLILDKKTVNIQLVQFLYKCLNQGKKLILLTKHDGNLTTDLKRFRLSGLFDQIIHIQEGQEKYVYVTEINAVFIDDSFAERQRVIDYRNIPAFGPEMIDVLLG